MTRGIIVAAMCAMIAACSFDSSGGGSPLDPIDPVDPGPGTPDAGAVATALQTYAGNETQLWRLDHETLDTELIGEFSGATDGGGFRCGGIALLGDGTLYAVSVGPPSTLYTVDIDTAALSNPIQLSNTDQTWGTTMIPAGTSASFSTQSDVLVLGGPAGVLLAVNPADGTSSSVGSFGESWGVSGDLTWVDGVGLVGTLDGAGNDRLAQISLTDARVTILGDTERGDVYGLASVDGQLWGLTGSGVIYEMDAADATEVTAMQGPTNWSIAAP